MFRCHSSLDESAKPVNSVAFDFLKGENLAKSISRNFYMNQVSSLKICIAFDLSLLKQSNEKYFINFMHQNNPGSDKKIIEISDILRVLSWNIKFYWFFLNIIDISISRCKSLWWHVNFNFSISLVFYFC